MGHLFSLQRITPEKSEQQYIKTLKNSSNLQISRNIFQYKHCMKNFNKQQSSIWIVQNKYYKNQRFFIKQINKIKIYNNKRIEFILNELILLTQQDCLELFIQVFYAFQDYQRLYLCMEYVQCCTLAQIIQNHTFTEEQTKYVVLVLIHIIQLFHQKGYILGELDPSIFIITYPTGKLKLRQIPTAIKINTYYPFRMVNKIGHYAAPEVLMMDKILAESDYYSIGILMYEMMTQKNPLINCEQNRYDILKQDISVGKSDLPEGWNPQAVDFLIKLLIKNPNLRLGKYGPYEVLNHPWLQNDTLQMYNSSRVTISLNEQYFRKQHYKKINQNQINQNQNIDCTNNFQFIHSYIFQKQFITYQYNYQNRNKVQQVKL